MALGVTKGVQKVAAVATLVAASVSNAFSQESQSSGETAMTNSTTSSAPFEPSCIEQGQYEKILIGRKSIAFCKYLICSSGTKHGPLRGIQRGGESHFWL